MKNNKIIINGRETGKTTFLLSQIDEYIKQEKNIYGGSATILIGILALILPNIIIHFR